MSIRPFARQEDCYASSAAGDVHLLAQDRRQPLTLLRCWAAEPSTKPATTTLCCRLSSSSIRPIGLGRDTPTTWLGWGSSLQIGLSSPLSITNVV